MSKAMCVYGRPAQGANCIVTRAGLCTRACEHDVSTGLGAQDARSSVPVPGVDMQVPNSLCHCHQTRRCHCRGNVTHPFLSARRQPGGLPLQVPPSRARREGSFDPMPRAGAEATQCPLGITSCFRGSTLGSGSHSDLGWGAQCREAAPLSSAVKILGAPGAFLLPQCWTLPCMETLGRICKTSRVRQTLEVLISSVISSWLCGLGQVTSGNLSEPCSPDV